MINTIREMARKALEGQYYTTSHDDTEHEWPLFKRYEYVERSIRAYKCVPDDHPMLALAYLDCINIDDVDDNLVFVNPWDTEKRVQNAKAYLKQCKKLKAEINNASSEEERYQIFAQNPDVFVEWLISFDNRINENKPGYNEDAYDSFMESQKQMIKMRDEVLKRLSPRYIEYRHILSSIKRSPY